jgi:hypothetical protein
MKQWSDTPSGRLCVGGFVFGRLAPVGVVSALVALSVVGGLVPAPSPAPGAPIGKVLPKMVTPETVKAIDRGLKFLERTQRHDGSWLNQGGYGSYPSAISSLAGLALMAGGSTPETGPYARNVNRLMKYLLNISESVKRDDGQIMIAGGGSEGRSMYGHGFGMLFLALCYGVEGDKTTPHAQRLRKVLDGAVLLTANAQSDIGAAHKHAGGWIYTPEGRSDEGSVTVTQLQALRAARNAGIKVPKQTIDRAVGYLKACQNPDGGISYAFRSRGSSQPAISAAAIACFYSAGIYDQRSGGTGPEAKMVERLVDFCKRNVHVNRGDNWFMYSHLYMSQAMYMRAGEDWKGYYPKVRDRLISMQMPDGNWNGDNIGPIYGTALACMILQLPYGYLPIMQR